MKAMVEKVSPYGVMIAGDWKNLSKFGPKPSLNGITAGDTVEIELQKDKFITAITKIGADGQPAPAGQVEPYASAVQKPVSGGKSFGNRSPEEQLAIRKQSAWGQVLGSPWLGEFYKTMDYAQAVSEARALVEKIVEYTGGVAAN